MKKLVKESLTENVHNKNEMEKYMYDNFDVIVNQYVIKLQKIFKDLLPWDNDSEYAPEDAAGIWWMEIVEPGWEPEILKNLPKRLDSNELIEIEDKAVEKAFEIIGVPHEITY